MSEGSQLLEGGGRRFFLFLPAEGEKRRQRAGGERHVRLVLELERSELADFYRLNKPRVRPSFPPLLEKKNSAARFEIRLNILPGMFPRYTAVLPLVLPLPGHWDPV